MSPYIIVLAGFGFVVLLTAWLPMLTKELPLSLPIACVALGALVFLIPGGGVAPHPLDHLAITERLSEFVVIISLMGAGLKLDRPLGWARWRTTWRLLGVAMPLTIVGLWFLGTTLLGLGTATALLLAAALAPTDPVLASDVQVGPPDSGVEDETRFALTSEAGLNDALAFPFVHCAIAMAVVAGTGAPWFADWFAQAVLWKLAAGFGMGLLLGRVLGWATFRLPNRAKLSRTGHGFVALGITAFVYGATEIVGGYGFLAVFVAALALRSVERGSEYNQRLHDFAEELERVLTMMLLVAFGGALVEAGLLRGVGWASVGFTILALFVIRPLAGWISLGGMGLPAGERGVISFFGIRGMGSIYYLAYAWGHAKFEAPDLVWGTLSLVILVSILLHGTTVTPIMRGLDRARGTSPPSEKRAAVPAATATSP